MKIKTANIRIFKPRGKTALKQVDVKQTIVFADELFFIHRDTLGKRWRVSYYTTGMSVGVYEGSVPAAKKAFAAIMERKAANLQKAVTVNLERYGAANELLEGGAK